MKTPSLHIVTPDERTTPVETVAQRIRRLQAEARELAADHIAALAQMMGDLKAMAEEIHGGGEAYPAGIRSVARDVAQGCESHAMTLQSIIGRLS
jgi:hypothetical protein